MMSCVTFGEHCVAWCSKRLRKRLLVLEVQFVEFLMFFILLFLFVV